MFFIICPQFLRTYLETKKNLNAAVISFVYLLYIYYIKKFNKNQIKIFYGSPKEVRTPIARLKAAFPYHLEDEAITRQIFNFKKPKFYVKKIAETAFKSSNYCVSYIATTSNRIPVYITSKLVQKYGWWS